MNIQQLEYIIAVDNHRHFSKAAEASYVTQPTLSMMIQKLEEELGAKIFDRTQLPIAPTPLGEKIIKQARMAVSQINQIKQIVQEERGSTSGIFRLGIIPTVSPYLLPRLMDTHSTINTGIQISVKELTTDNILKGLANDTLDGGILATPLGDELITETPLYYERFFAYVSPKERSLYVQNELSENDISNSKLWLLDEVHCFRTQILHLCNIKKKANPNSIFNFDAGSIETLIKIVDENDGITIIPEMAIDNLTETQKKNVRKIKGTTPVREISLITKTDFIRERVIEIIAEEIKSSVPHSFKDEALKKYIVPL